MSYLRFFIGFSIISLLVSANAEFRKVTEKDVGRLAKRGELLYYSDETKPFTGVHENMSYKGFPWYYRTFKDGRLHGKKWQKYVVNGQMAYVYIYEKGRLVSARGWHPNGKPNKTKVVNGNGITYELDIHAHVSGGFPGTTRVVSGPSGDLKSEEYIYRTQVYKNGIQVKNKR